MSHANSRVWFITGSSQGIGKALMDTLLAANERVVATLRKPEVLASYAEKYPVSQLLILRLDVTSVAEIDAAFAKVKEHFGRIDVVVNNAGYGLVTEVEGTPDAEARACFEACFWGAFNICQRAVPFMREVNPPGVGGRIFNVSSCGGYSAGPTLSIYNGAKFALEALTESLRKEMHPAWNIVPVIIELGGFRTEWSGSSLKTIPPPAAYTAADHPSALFRNMVFNGGHGAVGDPKKAGTAFIALADMKDPPLRVQFGTESYIIVWSKAKETMDDADKYVDLAHSTNADGVDKDAVFKMFGSFATIKKD